MEELTLRRLPDLCADGPTQMAADEVMLRAAAKGIASIRFYTWSTPTLSLGYFQPAASRLDDPLLGALPFVRRPTGGLTLVHHHELTYALAVPAGRDWRTLASWLRLHEIIADALAEFGVKAVPHPAATKHDSTSPLCFHHFTAGDLLIGSAKIVGSAQRRQHRAILQHGAVLLARSPFTPDLAGVKELAGVEVLPEALGSAIVDGCRRSWGWSFRAEAWSSAEGELIDELVDGRYRLDVWNRKR